MNRRDFLKTIGVIGAVGLVGKPQAYENFSGHPDGLVCLLTSVPA